MKSFVSLQMESTSSYATKFEKIDFYSYKNITVKLFAENNQTVELPFTDFEFSIFSGDEVKYIVDVKNVMSDIEYTVDYLNCLNLSECKNAEIVFDDENEPIKLQLDINFVDIEVEKNEDSRAKFRKIIEKIADENDDIFKALVDR